MHLCVSYDPQQQTALISLHMIKWQVSDTGKGKGKGKGKFTLEQATKTNRGVVQ
jgi:hypothetical protein